MDIEEETYEQMELWGEHTQIPQWEAVTDEVISGNGDTPSIHVPIESGFYHDLIEGDI